MLRPILAVAAFALGLSLAPACDQARPSDGDDGAGADARPGETPDPPDAGAIGTAGCTARPAAPGLATRTVMAGGVARQYRVFVPDAYDAREPTRLVFVFHGLGGDGNLIRSYFGIETEAAGRALFVYPDGLATQGGRTGWSTGDLAFFDAMITELSAAYCVDASRIFATGHSFGGYMSNLVGCSRGTVVRAIAPVSGGLLGGTCDRPVAAWIAHGDNDTVVEQSQSISARDRWRIANSCAATSAPTEPSPCVSYDGCSAGHAVTWCSFAGGHYPLPGFIRPAIWAFFEAF